MQELGFIDANGRRLNKELAPDMREESTADFLPAAGATTKLWEIKDIAALLDQRL